MSRLTHRLLLLFSSLVLLGLNPTYGYAEPIAVVVNRNFPGENIKLSDLARVYKGFLSRTPDGQYYFRIHRDPNSQLRQEFDRLVLGKQLANTENEAPTSAAQMTLQSDAALLNIVEHTPNAIGYLYAHKKHERTKVLRIDGYSPQDQGYPLK